ncbi:MAG: hypothetical protein KTR15_01660 [Phycisphaeraceae bacterium]|nr:hypothetical protein [Phycisphaeraceae bacterium]
MKHHPITRLASVAALTLAAGAAAHPAEEHDEEPTPITAEATAQVKPETLGHNNLLYQIDRGWGLVGDAKAHVSNAHAMIEDSEGQIYLVTDHADNAFLVYEKDGTFVRSFGTLQGGHGIDVITIGGTEYLIHVDAGWQAKKGDGWANGWNNVNGAVSIVDKQGKVLRTLPSPIETGHYKEGEKYKPCDVAVTLNGDILVADGYATDRVVHYKADGTIVRVWGGRKSGQADNLSNAHGISIDNSDPDNPVVWVSSRNENSLKLFTLEGEYIESLTFPGAYVGQACFQGDKIYIGVCWSKQDGTGKRLNNSGFVLVLDRKTRKVISAPGGTEPVYVDGELRPMHQAQPIFKHVHDLYVDKAGSIYVGEWNAGLRYPYKLERVAQ